MFGIIIMSIKLYNSQLAEDIVKDLLKINAIKLQPRQPFEWASGWLSPIYCDNRLSLSFPSLRTKIKMGLSLAISTSYNEVDAIAGVATAGIPQGVLVAQELGIPFIYVRSKTKGHGLNNLIEGKIASYKNIVVVEDLVSTGNSSLTAARVLQENGLGVKGMAAIFSYDLPIVENNFSAAHMDLITLSDYHCLLKYAKKAQLFDEKTLSILEKWRINPEQWK